MGIEEYINGLLTSDAALNAVVPAAKIFSGEAQEGAIPQYIVFESSGRTPYTVLKGGASADQFRVTISAYGKTPIDARQVAELIVPVIEAQGTFQFERAGRDPTSLDYLVQQDYFIHLIRS